MTDETDRSPDPAPVPQSAGERLRAAREARGLDLAEVAQRTRVPQRHLQAIEDGDYARIPTPTYAIGFAKAYARTVGEDEVAIARDVRARAETAAARRPEFVPYEPDVSPRGPSGGVMVLGAVLALLVLVGAGLWFGTTLFRGGGGSAAPGAPVVIPAPEPAASPAAAATPAGQVTLVASDEVWMRVYDAAGRTLLQRTLAPGERYDVPADADRPMINVGRPDKLQVLVNGAAVPALGSGRVAIKDVGISAAALAARAAPAGAPAPRTGDSDGAAPRGSPSPAGSRSTPAAFRSPAPAPTRTGAAPASTGQRDVPPAAADAAPGNAAS